MALRSTGADMSIKDWEPPNTRPLPTRIGNVDTTLGRKALFNIGDTNIASRTIETAEGTLQVQKQGNLVRMIMKAKEIIAVATECIPGPLTEVSRTYYTAERIYSTERIQFIDVKRLKTLVVNNGTEDITFCFSSPTTPAVASGAGKCFIENAFSTRTYHPIEPACASTTATTGTGDRGTMHAEFAIKRIATVTFKYNNVPFTYTFATPASATQTSSTATTCANSNSTEKSFLSRVLTSNKLSKVVMVNMAKALDYALNLTGLGLLGPAEFLKGTLTRFLAHNRTRISDLSEIVLFGQGWHGRGLSYITDVAPGNGYIAVSGVGNIGYALVARHGFIFKHPDATVPTTPAELLALGLEFKTGRIWGGFGSFINAGPDLTGLGNTFLWAVPGGATRRISCQHGATTLTGTTVSLYVYPETEYGVAATGYVLLTTVPMTHNRNVYSDGISVAPAPDGRKVLITLYSSTRALCVYEVTLDTALVNITSESVWVETDEYVTAVVLRAASSSETLTWSAGRYVEFQRDATTIYYDQVIDNTATSTMVSQVTKKMHFCVAAYDKLGRKAIVTLEVRYGALINFGGVYANAGTITSTGTWTYYNCAAQNIETSNWSYTVTQFPAGESPPDTAPISYPASTSTTQTPDTTYQNRWRFSGFADGGTIDLMPTDLTTQSDLALAKFNRLTATVWEARNKTLGFNTSAPHISRIRVAPDAFEHANVNCAKASSASGVSFANWDYDQETSSFIHDCFVVM